MSSTSSAYEKAYKILNHPEVYPGLVNRSLRDRRFLIWRYPSFESYRSWALFCKQEECWVRRVIWEQSRHFPSNDIDPDTYGCERLIPFEKAQELLTSLSEIHLKPLQQPDFFGLDGTISGIEVGNHWLFCRLSWWSVPSTDWQPLVIWFESTLSFFESVMPSSTAQ